MAQTVDSSLGLDVRHLSRCGYLELMGTVTLAWELNGEPCASIDMRRVGNGIRLSYRSSDDQVVDQDVRLDYTPCGFGGSRPWFLCPYCEGRVALLYLSGTFACRTCLGIKYESQSEDSGARALRRARKLRARLEAVSLVPPRLIMKPASMHWETFEKLVDALEDAELEGIEAQRLWTNRYLDAQP